MPKFTPPFVYVDRDAFLEDEAKYNHEIEQESLRASGFANGSVRKAE